MTRPRQRLWFVYCLCGWHTAIVLCTDSLLRGQYLCFAVALAASVVLLWPVRLEEV